MAIFTTRKPAAHDASFLHRKFHNVGLASYGAGCYAGLQARCCSFVAHSS